MSNYTESNVQLLEQQFHQSLKNYRDAEPLPDQAPGQIQLPLNNEEACELPVVPNKYREIYTDRIEATGDQTGVLCVGIETPDDLPEVGSKLDEDEPLVYAESSPAVFKAVLERINLARLGTECDLSILFEQSIPDLILRSCLTLGNNERDAGALHSLVSPSLFARWLSNDCTEGDWITMLIQNLHHNQFAEQYHGERSWSDRLTPTYPYEKVLHTLDGALVGSPGIKTLYEESVEPHEVDSTEPVSIAVLADGQWDQTRNCVESIQETNLPDNTNIIIANDGRMTLSPDRINYFNDAAVSPEFKSYPEEPRSGLCQAISAETRAETIVFVSSSAVVREKNWLEKLLKPLRMHPRVGASGAESFLQMDDDAATTLENTWLPGLTLPVNYVNPHCIAVRKSAIEQLSGRSADQYHSREWSLLDLQWSIRSQGWMINMPAEAPLIETGTLSGLRDEPKESRKQGDQQRFREQWGARRRIVNLARNNDTAETYQPTTEPEEDKSRSRTADQKRQTA